MCKCSNGTKDQTNATVFDYIQKQRLNLFAEKNPPVGFGLFLVPAPEEGVLESKTVTVEGLTYEETIKRGHNCEAFQWIPKGISIKTTKGTSLKILTTDDIFRISDCTSSRCKPSGCPMGCWCRSGEVGYCKRNKSSSFPVMKGNSHD